MSTSRVPGARARRAGQRRRGSLMSTIVTAAVTAVVVAVALTAWTLHEANTGPPQLAVLQPATSAQAGPPQPAVAGVVTAPPLRRIPAAPRAGDPAQQPATNALGAPSACPNCGVVEAVVAVHEYGQAQPSAYLMHIRMDDGSVLSIQHRGAFAPGSRVAVEGDKLRPAQ